MNIEPSLQSFIDSYTTIARATFAKGGDEKTLENTALLTFAGMGLAKQIRTREGATWVKTEQLIELEKEPDALLDLSEFMAQPVLESDEPSITESLRLIIADIISVAKAKMSESAELPDLDTVLLGLAGQGLIEFIDDDDGMIWTACPGLIDWYETGKRGLERVSMRHKPKSRMDETVGGIVRRMQEMAAARFGQKLDKAAARAGTIAFLLGGERQGEVIAYLDAKGRLAWRASDQLANAFA